MVAIARQPLFPHSSKEAIQKAESSTRFADAMATVRRSHFARNAAAQQTKKNVGVQDAPSGGFFSLACAQSNSLGGRCNTGTNSDFPPKFEFGCSFAPPGVKNPLANGRYPTYFRPSLLSDLLRSWRKTRRRCNLSHITHT